ncbi:MAG: decaprenyl-phosphate phosphoribosyltransferase [Sedimentisphaerales bacterium]|nr:decaprenyl-phosphate phosphoribosyltransferase [Sedimentisphaerales bacterium]
MEVSGSRQIRTLVFIWRTIRPKQWTKNLFVFAALLFSQNIFNFSLLSRTILAFFIFCILSGAVYILNDLLDLKQDRLHPAKSHRPIASGKLKSSHAFLACLIFVGLSLGMSYYLRLPFFLVVLLYFLLQLGYSLFLKHVVILDIFAVACGFILRIIAGALVIDVEMSSWFLICAMFLALFLSLSKRRHELVVLGDQAEYHRKVLKKYSPYLLDQMIAVVTASTVMAYSLYTMSEQTVGKFGTKNLVFTTPFVLFGIFRYLYLVHHKDLGGRPEIIILADKPLMVDIVLWVLTTGVILYS